MTALSNYLENALLDEVLRNTGYTPVSTVYVALFTSTATLSELETSTLTNEVVAGGFTYARQSCAFDAASGGVTQNTSTLTWTNMPGVTVGYVAVMDASTAGNVLFGGALVTPKVVNAGDPFSIAAGQFIVTLS